MCSLKVVNVANICDNDTAKSISCDQGFSGYHNHMPDYQCFLENVLSVSQSYILQCIAHKGFELGVFTAFEWRVGTQDIFDSTQKSLQQNRHLINM